jgi:hypothetical protein
MDISPLKDAFDTLEKAKFFDRVTYLKGRWLDEREYENFDEYVKVARNALPSEFTLKKMSKGFELLIQRKDQIFKFRVGLRRITGIRI